MSAVESPGTTADYSYDLAGNREGIWVNGKRTLTQIYNPAEVIGRQYDVAGNLLGDGTATITTYDALNRPTA